MNKKGQPGLTIYPNQRKMYRDKREIVLTTKEYDLFFLLADNQGQVLKYTQIYEKVWGSGSAGNEKIIRFHFCNLSRRITKNHKAVWKKTGLFFLYKN